jgi:hypothetical protein
MWGTVPSKNAARVEMCNSGTSPRKGGFPGHILDTPRILCGAEKHAAGVARSSRTCLGLLQSDAEDRFVVVASFFFL